LSQVRYAFLSVLLASTAMAASDSEATREATRPTSEPAAVSARPPAPTFPVFIPQRRSAPRVRQGGASRGSESDGFPVVDAVVPEHVGLTLSSQPVLYWHLSSPTDQRVDFTLIDEDSPRPLVEVTLKGPFRAGLQRIDTSRYGVKLRRGADYQWFVAVVSDPERRSSDVIAGGGIQRIRASSELRSQLDGADAERVPFVLAEHGIWYDAVDQLSRRITASPDDTLLRRQRAALLSQVGLGRVAEADTGP
jgi:hypothetical protein